MDRHLIKTLIDVLAASDLSELEYSQDGATLRLVKRRTASAGFGTAPVASDRPPVLETSPAPSDTVVPNAAMSGELSAPMYGIVHLQPSPGAPPFARAGDTVRAGQTLCLMEAMKVFSELRAERDGSVRAVLVEAGQEVEAGQALFVLDWGAPADV
jgi:acetyl-CoA carboxylase biotin carboxyl carrier protein